MKKMIILGSLTVLLGTFSMNRGCSDTDQQEYTFNGNDVLKHDLFSGWRKGSAKAEEIRKQYLGNGSWDDHTGVRDFFFEGDYPRVHVVLGFGGMDQTGNICKYGSETGSYGSACVTWDGTNMTCYKWGSGKGFKT